MITAVAIYCIAVGLLMFGWWAVEVRGGVLRRPDRQPVEIALHGTAELVTAASLLLGGALLLAAGAASFTLAALGMLLYTLIQSPGYFIARREIAPVVMFAALVALTIAALGILLVAS
jgi:hypothetical protein